MTRVGFIIKPDKQRACELLEELGAWLIGRGDVVVVVDEDGVQPSGAMSARAREFAEAVDIAVVLGGDGTMLRANALIDDAGVPILGINLGRLGFLTSFDPDNAREALERALSGQLARQQRMRLHLRYLPESGAPIERTALNDVVINQGAIARLLDLEARLDGALISRYRVDGLIIATPTGSTAYNLAAGGPIVYPGHEAMTLTPICPHGLTDRPLVMPSDGVIDICLARDSAGVLLTVDGSWAHGIGRNDRVQVTKASTPLTVFAPDSGYFDILRHKLHWGVRTEQ